MESDIHIPSWIESYYILNEQSLSSKKQTYLESIKVIQNEIQTIDYNLKVITDLKSVLYSSGTKLENSVKQIFLNLGFELIQSEAERADAIFKYEDKILVFEIKGVVKSATETHASQLDKWISNYDIEYDVYSKGLLIVNAFCGTPLNERTLNPFPNQMLKYCSTRNHCLITTTQLLCLYIDCIKNPPKNKQTILDL